MTLGRAKVPAMLSHPDWRTPRPTVLWMHGRTVSKEIDNGRFLRFVRAGIASVSLDLPGHGERLDAAMQHPGRTLDVIEQMLGEVDQVVAAIGQGELAGLFDGGNLAIGGMSAGGMVALRRLCDAHPFKCAAVEGTAGNLKMLYLDTDAPAERVGLRHPAERVARLSAIEHLALWRPMPILALHSESDRVVPLGCIRTFVDALGEHYTAVGADAGLVELTTWPQTGAPEEHNGFGKVGAEAKTRQVEFLTKAFGIENVG